MEEDFAVERPDLVTENSTVEFDTEHAPHTLFKFKDASTGGEMEEKLKLHAFYDGSVLEIFLNERTAITTRIYTHDARTVGLGFFSEAEGDTQEPSAVITKCSVWDGLSCD